MVGKGSLERGWVGTPGLKLREGGGVATHPQHLPPWDEPHIGLGAGVHWPCLPCLPSWSRPSGSKSTRKEGDRCELREVAGPVPPQARQAHQPS